MPYTLVAKTGTLVKIFRIRVKQPGKVLHTIFDGQEGQCMLVTCMLVCTLVRQCASGGVLGL